MLAANLAFPAHQASVSALRNFPVLPVEKHLLFSLFLQGSNLFWGWAVEGASICNIYMNVPGKILFPIYTGGALKLERGEMVDGEQPSPKLCTFIPNGPLVASYVLLLSNPLPIFLTNELCCYLYFSGILTPFLLLFSFCFLLAVKTLQWYDVITTHTYSPLRGKPVLRPRLPSFCRQRGKNRDEEVKCREEGSRGGVDAEGRLWTEAN